MPFGNSRQNSQEVCPELKSSQEAEWNGLAEFKTHVPWNDVKHNYQIDSAFYDRLQEGGGCSSRLTHGPFKDIVFAAKKRLPSSRQGHRAP